MKDVATEACRNLVTGIRRSTACTRPGVAGQPPRIGDITPYCLLPFAFCLPVLEVYPLAACLFPPTYQLSSRGQIFVACATGNTRRAASAAR